MERFREIANIWNWLPAFRAVAETEHLPTASEMMHVTAPALSRTVKQLEEHLGYEVFDRVGRGLVLNERGERLLRAVRNSMRLIDDVLVSNEERRFVGQFRWSGNWSLSDLVLGALDKVVREHPEFRPQMLTYGGPIEERLRTGELDLVVSTGKVEGAGITATPLGPAPNSVYCGRKSDLYGVEGVTWDAIEGRRFAAPVRDASGNYMDGFPPERTREVIMEFSQMAVGFRACRDTDLLAVLPDDVVVDEDGLWRLLPLENSPHIFAVHRETLDTDGPVELIVELVRGQLAARRSSSAE
jgi:DNA-binding transcriptional LysR family regulator